MAVFRRMLEEAWYARHPAAVLLVPFEWGFRSVVGLRRAAYRQGLFRIYEAEVPVIVVGNLTVGGTGKTPLVIWLAGYLQAQGYRPGIVSRGYGGRARKWPQQVRADSDPSAVGDEAIVISRRTRCPVAVGPDRGANVAALLAHSNANIVISDDGLQHYALARTVEIVVVDGVRRFGNGHCLPAGPLREPASRAREVDLVVTNGIAGRGEFAMKYVATGAVTLQQRRRIAPLDSFVGTGAHAVAGIGNPDRFFSMLRAKGIRVQPHAFPDHHEYQTSDFEFGDELPVLMTEKDAVKCESFANPRLWSVPITAELPDLFAHRLLNLLTRPKNGQKTA